MLSLQVQLAQSVQGRKNQIMYHTIQQQQDDERRLKSLSLAWSHFGKKMLQVVSNQLIFITDRLRLV